MKHAIAFALVFCGLCCSGMCESTSAVFYSYHDGKRYDFSVTPELLANSPRWLEDQLDPPLPVRQAIAAAGAYLAKLFPDAKQTLSNGGVEWWH